MSANLDLVRSIYTTWERGDFSSTEWADPEIEWVRNDGPDPGTWRGLDGMAASSREYMGAWEDMRFEAEEHRELYEGRILVLTRISARGRSSGFEVGQLQARSAALWQLHAGKVKRIDFWYDSDLALADLGLKE
jgi:ketosteroid isomerase-like protein